MAAPSSSAPTAGAVLRALARRRFQNSLAALVDIADADHDAAIAALGRVPRGARIDVHVLVETLRREAHERAEARRASADPARYEALLISQGYVPYLPRAKPPPTFGQAADDVQPNGDLEDGKEQPRRRSIPRLPSRREAREPKPKPRPRPEPGQSFYLGPKAFGAGIDSRPYGCPEGADYNLWRSPTRPPWLLDDGDPEEPDDELDDETDDDEPEENADATTSR